MNLNEEYLYESLNLLLVAKKVFDIGRQDLLDDWKNVVLDEEFYFDSYYEFAFNLIEEIFDSYEVHYYEMRNFTLSIFSNDFIEQYYIFAAQYGLKMGLDENQNPFFISAEQEMCSNFNFNYSLDWLLKGHGKP